MNKRELLAKIKCIAEKKGRCHRCKYGIQIGYNDWTCNFRQFARDATKCVERLVNKQS